MTSKNMIVSLNGDVGQAQCELEHQTDASFSAKADFQTIRGLCRESDLNRIFNEF